MTPFTIDEIAAIVIDAPTDGWSWPWCMVNAVTIALAESAGDPRAVHVVDNPLSNAHLSIDRGLWQLNDYWHSEVSSRIAFTPALAVIEVQRISKNGTSWSGWTTFNGARQRSFIPAARTVLQAYGARV